MVHNPRLKSLSIDLYAKQTKTLIMFLIICLIGVSGVLYFSELENKKAYEICKKWKNEAFKVCVECSKTAESYNSLISCMAITGIADLGINFSKEMCSLLGDEKEERLCFADALRRVDLEKSLEVCKSINETDMKNFCMALTLRLMDRNEEAINRCKSINDTVVNLQCLGIVTGDSKYCYQIPVDKVKEDCLNALR